jgi:hypothetical protein
MGWRKSFFIKSIPVLAAVPGGDTGRISVGDGAGSVKKLLTLIENHSITIGVAKETL